MTPKPKTAKKPEAENPLWGYTAAIETLVGVARGRIRSETRLEAARILLEHCAFPPTGSWDFEEDDE